jgi:hypothetical protein
LIQRPETDEEKPGDRKPVPGDPHPATTARRLGLSPNRSSEFGVNDSLLNGSKRALPECSRQAL